MEELHFENDQRKPGKFKAVLKRIFVHNIGWKILSVVSAFLIWVLVAGLW